MAWKRRGKLSWPTLQRAILILTAHESEQLVREVLSAGAQGYVLKSDAGRTLITALQALLEGGSFFTSNVARMVLGWLPTQRIA